MFLMKPMLKMNLEKIDEKFLLNSISYPPLVCEQKIEDITQTFNFHLA